MPENDRTRWIGIRPTNPAESIPVTVAGGAIAAQVEPVPGCDPFPVITRKYAPAIGDVLAISEILVMSDGGFMNASVSVTQTFGPVPVDEIWVVQSVGVINATTMCDIEISFRLGADTVFIASGLSIPKLILFLSQANAILTPGAFMDFKFKFGGAVDIGTWFLGGYIVEPYT